jgi:GDPmannose 4,6-dehydratase
VNEVGINEKTGDTVIRIDERYFRPTEVEFLLGDPTKAKEKFGWVPEYTFEALVKEMVDKDIEFLAQGKEYE